MCTIGGLGRHIGRQSTDISVDYRSAIDRLSVDSQPIVDRQQTDSRPIVDRQSTDIQTDSRPMHHPICTHLSVYRSTIDRQSVDCRPIVDRLSTDSRPIVGRQSTDISADVSADMSTEATYSTHDPLMLHWLVYPIKQTKRKYVWLD